MPGRSIERILPKISFRGLMPADKQKPLQSSNPFFASASVGGLRGRVPSGQDQRERRTRLPCPVGPASVADRSAQRSRTASVLPPPQGCAGRAEPEEAPTPAIIRDHKERLRGPALPWLRREHFLPLSPLPASPCETAAHGARRSMRNCLPGPIEKAKLRSANSALLQR